jgi:phosphoribosylaminoimidazole-succinocarboxamide synthase
MVVDAEIFNQLNLTLDQTNFSTLGARYQGKVRDTYSKDGRRYLIATDRLSCFDRVVTTVPFKGEVLTKLAANWFKLTSDIIENHVIDLPDPNVMLVKDCEIVPIEVIVRGYLAGSAWRDYQAGREISGVRLPSGLTAYSKLPKIILTPSTKAPIGSHDMPISEDEIVSSGKVDKSLWQQIREAALSLFALGEEVSLTQGLILVDTKYEFGLLNGKLILADEIHTLDSSRFWLKSSYVERISGGLAPEMLDKEPTRQWLLAQGFKGDGEIPHFTDEHRISIAKHYISAFEKITGLEFSTKSECVTERIKRNLGI